MNARKEYAVTVTAREQAELLPFDAETAPLGAREVAGRTLATLISPGTELAGCYQGGSFPSVPGYAAVFEVEEVGAEIEDIKPGDRVFCMGPHRSYQRCQRDALLPVPDALSPEVAVFCRMMGISMTTLSTTAARPPEKVLVTGLGLVGHLAAKIFASCGYEVTACDPLQPRREIAIRSGIARVLPAVPLDDPEFASQVGLVLECSGHEQAALDGCRVVKKRGEVVLVGTPWRRQTELFAHDLLRAVFHNYVVLRSGWEWELPMQATDFRVNSLFGNFASALQWLAQGRIRVDGLYELAPPREAQRVYQDLLHHSSSHLTAVFDWTNCP
jgi:threonine dehydrogenase-like Zn-dependent dehydrogenase